VSRPVRLVIFGRQGAGKGTQSALLAGHFGAPHISTGDMLREAVAAGTEFGRKAKEFMDAGQLLPDDIMLGVIDERLARPDVQASGFLLDGYPRNVDQAKTLADLTPIDVALHLGVPEEVVLERISSRRVCQDCGRIHNAAELDGASTCEACGGTLVQRDDDKPEAIARRLEIYREQTMPAIEWFAGMGRLVEVSGLGTPDEVSQRLIAAIDERLAARS
jgi:adenylate kinase